MDWWTIGTWTTLIAALFWGILYSTRHGGRLAWLGPYLLLAAATAWLAVRWAAIPERFATHWGFSFEPDGWMAKSVVSIFWPFLAGLGMCALMAVIAYVSPRLVASSGRAEAAEHERRMARASRQTLLATSYFLALLFGLVLLSPLLQATVDVRTVGALIVAAGFLAAAVLIVYILVALLPEVRASARALTAADPDGAEHWKWGLVYYNPGDPAVFVTKRLGIGYTLNMARPASWAVLVALLGGPLLVTALLIANV